MKICEQEYTQAELKRLKRLLKENKRKTTTVLMQ